MYTISNMYIYIQIYNVQGLTTGLKGACLVTLKVTLRKIFKCWFLSIINKVPINTYSIPVLKKSSSSR